MGSVAERMRHSALALPAIAYRHDVCVCSWPASRSHAVVEYTMVAAEFDMLRNGANTPGIRVCFLRAKLSKSH